MDCTPETDLNQLKMEQSKLLARNEEIRRIKSYRKFRVIIPEVVKEFNLLEQEGKGNLKRIDAIDTILVQ